MMIRQLDDAINAVAVLAEYARDAGLPMADHALTLVLAELHRRPYPPRAVPTLAAVDGVRTERPGSVGG